MESRWRHLGIRPDAHQIREAVSLYQAGWTYKEIGKKFNRSQSNIWVWINNFAKDLDDPNMKEKNQRMAEKRERATKKIWAKASESGVEQPEVEQTEAVTANTADMTEAELKARVAHLERELRDARMMKDFYEEMINIAENDFKIKIRKKGGARQ